MTRDMVTGFIAGLQENPPVCAPAKSDVGSHREQDLPMQQFFDQTHAAIHKIKNPERRRIQIDSLSRDLKKLLTLSSAKIFAVTLERGSTLSAILDNLKNTVAQIGNISNLPPEASVIQQEAITVINQSLTATASVQVEARSFVGNNYSKLETAKTDLEDPSVPVASIIEAIQQISTEAQVVKIKVDELQTGDTIKKIGALNAQSKALEMNYASKVAALQVLVADARQRLNKAEEERWYFLALGVFGLIGLAIALGIILSINNELNDLNNQINEYNTSLVHAKALNASISTLNSLYDELLQQVIFLNNDLNFIIGELNNIILNLNNPDADRTVVSLYVVATLTSMKQLGEYVA